MIQHEESVKNWTYQAEHPFLPVSMPANSFYLLSSFMQASTVVRVVYIICYRCVILLTSALSKRLSKYFSQ